MCASASAQNQTTGLFFRGPSVQPGYTLFSPLSGTETYLIDVNGERVHTWVSDYVPGNSYYLTETGLLVRTADPGGNPVFSAGGDAGLVEVFNWDGDLVWSYLYSNDQHRAHHDIAIMPNGNVLILAWEFRSGAESLAAGRDPANLPSGVLWPETVVEVRPTGPTTGDIVWEWRLWDHLIQDFDASKDNFGVVADHPELVDINYENDPTADWIHANALDYNAELDQIMICANRFFEVWVIDHSTTTEEAAGHTGGNSGKGGDLLYRWGNPQAYDRGGPDDQRFFNQHDAHWIAPGLPGAGNILVFNNGRDRPAGDFSSVEEFAPPLNANGDYVMTPGQPFGPADPGWSFTAANPEAMFASFLSGAQRQPNGNTLMCLGPWGVFAEVDPLDRFQWLYVNPVTASGALTQGEEVPFLSPTSTANRAFRAVRYPENYPGLAGRDLTPQGPLEGRACAADLSGLWGQPDGSVNGFDFLAVVQQLGTDGLGADLAPPLDLVDFADLQVVVQAIGNCQ